MLAFLWAVPGNPFRGNAEKLKNLNEKGHNPEVVGDGPVFIQLAKACGYKQSGITIK